MLDIKPLIYGFQVTDRGGVPSFYLKLSTGSTDNLKPELVLEALFLHMGLTYDPNAIQIHRKDVYASDGDDFVSLRRDGRSNRMNRYMITREKIKGQEYLISALYDEKNI